MAACVFFICTLLYVYVVDILSYIKDTGMRRVVVFVFYKYCFPFFNSTHSCFQKFSFPLQKSSLRV